jgi:hypothetical protein
MLLSELTVNLCQRHTVSVSTPYVRKTFAEILPRMKNIILMNATCSYPDNGAAPPCKLYIFMPIWRRLPGVPVKRRNLQSSYFLP